MHDQNYGRAGTGQGRGQVDGLLHELRSALPGFDVLRTNTGQLAVNACSIYCSVLRVLYYDSTYLVAGALLSSPFGTI